MKKTTIYTIAAMLLTILSCGRNSTPEAEVKKAADSADLRIAVMPSMDCMPFYVAQECGLFDKENMKVRLVAFTAHMDIDTALVGGSVDMGITDKYRMEKLNERGAAVAPWAPAQTELTLVANRKSRLTKTEQFEGKVVAMTRESATEHLSQEAFKSLTGRQPYLVQINDVLIRKHMLLSNELDAAWMQEPQVSEALAHGHNIVNATVEKEPLGQFVYRKKGRYAQPDGDKLRRIYNEACDSINKNGIKKYATELRKYCQADTAAIGKMGTFRFRKI